MNAITDFKQNLTPILPFKDLPLFDDVWKNCDADNEPVAEVGYIRADYDGYRWWNTCWHKHKELETPELIAEIDAVYEAFKAAFPDFDSMLRWCSDNSSAVSDDEYNAYYVGEHGCYWLRMITRFRDYNLYLHCYSKAAMKKGE